MHGEIALSEVLSGSAELPVGRYRHYNGKEYSVLGLATHSDTRGELVVYRQEYGKKRLWITSAPRP